MNSKLGKICLGLAATAIISLSLGRYFDSQCEMGCLMAAGKDVIDKKGGDWNIQITDDDRDEIKGNRIEGPLLVKLPDMKTLATVKVKVVSTEVKVMKGDQLEVKAFEYRTDKEWEITGSGGLLSLDFLEKGPERVEITLPANFAGKLNISSVSGDLEIGQAMPLAELDLQSTSGDISIASWPTESLSINTVSADVSGRNAGEAAPQKVKLQAVSGDFNIEIPSGFETFTANTVSGNVNVKFTGKKPEFEYRLHSISGDFRGIPGAVVQEGIANRETGGKVGEPKGSRLEFESISGDFELTL